MPTCSAVGCENRTSSGVQFFRTPAGSQNRRRLWHQTLKRIDWNDATRLILISAMTASHPMLRASILARLGMFVYNEVGHKSARSVIARLEKLFRGFPNFDSLSVFKQFPVIPLVSVYVCIIAVCSAQSCTRSEITAPRAAAVCVLQSFTATRTNYLFIGSEHA